MDKKQTKKETLTLSASWSPVFVLVEYNTSILLFVLVKHEAIATSLTLSASWPAICILGISRAKREAPHSAS